ncbi:MAG: hypothetical protein IT307_18725 [Chloroflexi bacterium]|nr:hypothetical protein [Chloroflexota bacterium]
MLLTAVAVMGVAGPLTAGAAWAAGEAAGDAAAAGEAAADATAAGEAAAGAAGAVVAAGFAGAVVGASAVFGGAGADCPHAASNAAADGSIAPSPADRHRSCRRVSRHANRTAWSLMPLPPPNGSNESPGSRQLSLRESES